MKKFIYKFSIFILVFFFLPINVCANIKPDDVSFTDYSGIISDGVKEYVKSKNEILFANTGAKIIFVTTDTTDGLNANEYAKKLYSSSNIGKIGRGNSVFVLVDSKSLDYAVIQGKNIKRMLTDNILYDIIAKDFEPHFAKGNFDDAIMSLYNSLGRWYEQHYTSVKLNPDDDYSKYKSSQKTKDEDADPSRNLLWISVVVVVLMIIIFFNIKRRADFKTRQHERHIKRKKNKADIDKIVNL